MHVLHSLLQVMKAFSSLVHENAELKQQLGRVTRVQEETKESQDEMRAMLQRSQDETRAILQRSQDETRAILQAVYRHQLQSATPAQVRSLLPLSTGSP